MLKPYYERDGVTIYNGDAMEILPELSGVDALVADPPYSSGGQFRSDRMRGTVEKYVNSDTMTYRPEFSGDNRDQRSFFAWCSLWLSFSLHVSNVGAHALVFTDWRQLPTITDALQAGGWVWRGLATWHKPGIRMQRGGFSQSAEYIAWGTAGPWSRENDHAPQNVIQCAPVGDGKIHIAEKPIAVVDALVKFAPIGGLVLDPFMGSGTTLLAARGHNRRAIGIEIEERYCEIAARRLDACAVLDFGPPPAQPEQGKLLEGECS